MKLYYKDDLIELYHGDCLKVMEGLIKQNIKVDAIITDIPYGTTACSWDIVIPFNDMWNKIESITKETSPIVLFGSEPFSSYLRLSNINNYKYDWKWKKSKPTGSALAKKRPMKSYEDIMVFYKKQGTYNPQMTERTEEELKRLSKKSVLTKGTDIQPLGGHTGNRDDNKYKYPNSVLEFKSVPNTSKDPLVRTSHPTQKPLDLMEYLINTYTNENDLILDFTCGSGTTLVAAKKLHRKCIGIELDEKYCEIAKNRLLNI